MAYQETAVPQGRKAEDMSSSELYIERRKRVAQNMKQEGVQSILVSAPASIFYLSGAKVYPGERMLALKIDEDGEALLFANALFGLDAGQMGIEIDVHTDNDDPVESLAKTLRAGALGIDKTWPSKFLIRLMELRADVKPVQGSGPVDNARMLKDEAERNALRAASLLNDKAVEAAIASLREGITEMEAYEALVAAYESLGADTPIGGEIVAFGENAADPHHMTDNSVLQGGMCALFDIFTPLKGYWCDMTRTVFFGEASKKGEEVYETVRLANEAGIAAVKPGTPLSEIDGAARKIIEDAGYGPNFTHRLGHGIGLEEHEPPDVSGASQAIATPGMCFSIEPGIYLPGEFGVRIEDLVLVTEDGCEVLNHYSKALQIVG